MQDEVGKIVDGPIRTAVWIIVAICLLLALFALLSHFVVRRIDPLKRPHGLAWLLEVYVNTIDRFVINYMGERFLYLAPYFAVVFIALPLAFLMGLFSLPAPISIISVPLTFAAVTFILIHATCIRNQGLGGWFKAKFLSPHWSIGWIFFPINCIALFSPLLSLSFRLYGNGLSGNVLMKIIYWATAGLPRQLQPFGFNLVGAVVAAPLHLYFDVFSALIQTLVFVLLSAMFIALEGPAENLDPQKEEINDESVATC